MSVNAQQTKYVLALAPISLAANASATVTAVDTLGADYAEFVVWQGVTDCALTTLKLTECDTSGGSYTDVTPSVWGTANDIAGVASTLPTATDDNKFFVYDVDLRNRKRFLKPAITAGTGTTSLIACWANLSRMPITPVIAADRGCKQILRF